MDYLRSARHTPITRFFGPVDFGLLVTVLLSLPALAPLLSPGYFASHDGQLHLYRLMGLDQAVRAGVLYPRWFPDFAFGYGHPILNFYGPLSYYVAEIAHALGMGLIGSMKLAYGAAMLAAGIAMYLFARRVFGGRRWPAIVAALGYVYAPYHLANLYVRGALAELMAMAWFPFILWSFTCLVADHRREHLVITAAGLAGLIMTHSLSLVIFGPLLVAYGILLWVSSQQIRSIEAVTGALILAFALSALYGLPAYTESHYVGLAEGRSSGYQQHLAPLNSFISSSFVYHYFPHQGTVAEHPAGLLQLLAAGLGVLALADARAPLTPLARRVTGLTALLAAGSLFMTTTTSLPVWKAFEPIVSFLQYPWRFQAMSALGGAFLAGAGVVWGERIGRARRTGIGMIALACLLIALLMVTSLAALPYQRLELSDEDITLERMWREEREVGQIGTTWTGEYLPIWVQEQRWAIGRSWLDAGGPNLEEANAPRAPEQVMIQHAGYATLDLAVSARQPSTLILHQFYYPGMVARLGHTRIPAHPYGTLGLVAFDLPAGEHTVSCVWEPTSAQWIGLLLSLLGLACVAAILWLMGQRRALAVTAGIVLLVAGVLLLRGWMTPDSSPPVEVQAELEGKASLLAYVMDRPAARPGQEVALTLFWMARQGFPADLVTFVHLSTPDGARLITQSDQQPAGGFTPTTRWLAGEIIPDRHTLHLPAEIAPGRYPLYAGMYELGPLRNLEIISSARPAADGRVLLGYLEVIGP